MFYNNIIVLSLPGLGQHVGYAVMDLIIDTTGTAVKATLQYLLLIFYGCVQLKITLANRAAEDFHKFFFHNSSRISMICDISGPVDINPIRAPMSSSA